MKSLRRATAFRTFAAVVSVAGGMVGTARADLLLYDPFDYGAGQTLGGTDPDGAGPTAGTPVGQTNTYTGGGTWYARGTTSNYQSPNDAVISGGSLSYTGLAPSIGNSASYGSAAGNVNLFSDTIDIPGADVTSGPLFASFIIRIKSNASTLRHSPAGFVTDTSSAGTAGTALASGSGTAAATPGLFWMRRDPVATNVTNFSPGKSSSDGIGSGATGPSAGWQDSRGSTNIETNQFGTTGGQAAVNNADSSTYQTYFVVLKYTFDQMVPAVNSQNDTVSLWMNPGSGTLGQANGETLASQNPTGTVGSYYAAVNAFGTATLDVTAIKSFALIGHRQNTTESIAVDFDELRIGTTWADVTPAGPQTYYWDVNGTANAGSGGPSPAGNWDGATANFNTSSAGTAGTTTANPGAADTVVFSAGSDATGSYNVALSGTKTVAALKVKDGTPIISGGTINAGSYDVASGASGVVFSNVAGSVTKTGAGTLILASSNTYTGGTTVNGGKLQVTRLQENNAVTINAGATLQVLDSTPTLPSTPSGDNAFVSRPGSLATPASLTIANNGAPLGSRVYTGTLDLGNNDLIIDYSGTSPYADLQDMLRSGFNGGTWTGTGITSSTAANALANNNYALGIAENGTLVTPFGDGTGINPQFSGQTVDNTTVLIKFTHRADLNLDGLITSNDAAVFNSSYQQGASGATWQTGDLNYNGTWDSNDAAIFNSFYNESLSHLPEPVGAAGILGLLGIGALRRNRRHA